ncbi:hypothetical protein [Methylobacterium nonmethylotrophicum]|uniref:Uncharacterized protein n=1 Tax=Methylobacterium nonmethylotrophicum TaxID=1141884 RepID=A0A4Z0NLF1_9HYPH|nr:hypothetical protein [Methylobacterium nonmethylotrophicum]TGD96640.1 hypothetical protein EU555_23110 [Methylobacterium nonmethylotrophicum]
MKLASLVRVAALGSGLGAAAALSDAQAAKAGLSGYQGAWVLSGSNCAEIYSPASKGVSFKKPIDLFAPAFMVSGDRLRTPAASCRITSARPNGERQLLILNCANAVAANEVKVLMKIMPNGFLRRYYHEQDTAGIDYERCGR